MSAAIENLHNSQSSGRVSGFWFSNYGIGIIIYIHKHILKVQIINSYKLIILTSRVHLILFYHSTMQIRKLWLVSQKLYISIAAHLGA